MIYRTILALVILISTIVSVDAKKRKYLPQSSQPVVTQTYSARAIYPDSCRRSTEEIDKWLESTYGDKDVNTLGSDVLPRSRVWDHLVNEHHWSRSQIKHLDMRRALYLHDASHKETYETYRFRGQ